MKYLVNLVLYFHFAWRAYCLRREPDWAYYQQFFAPLNPQWQALAKTNQHLRLTYVGLGLAGLIFSCIFLVIYLQNIDYQIINLTIGLGALGILTYLFFRLRQQGFYWYQQFHQEVEQRLKNGKNTQISDYQRLILNEYLFYSHPRIFKMLGIMAASLALGLYGYEEVKRLDLTKPEHLSREIKQKIIQNKKSIDQLKTTLVHNRQNLQATEVKIRVNQNLLKIAQGSVQEQYYALFQSQGFRNTLDNIRQKIYQLQKEGKNTAQIEHILRNDALIWSQIKGLAEVRLSLLEEDTNQAEAKLGQSGETLKSFQDLVFIYHRMHEKAQIGLGLDNHKIKRLKADIDRHQCLAEKLKIALRQDSALISQNQQAIHQLQTQLQKRQAKLAKASQK
jgi:hypothetical protein